MPTGDVIEHKSFNLGMSYGFDFVDSTGGKIPQKGILKYTANLGAMKGLELGLLGQTEKGMDRFKEGVFINMKYGLASEDAKNPLKLAVGIENLTSSGEADAYLVASQAFKHGYTLHFGAMFDFPDGKFRPLGMVGLTLPFFHGTLEVLSELFAGESLLQADAGVRVMFTNDVGLALNVLNMTNSPVAKNTQSAFVGLSWQDPF